MPKGGTRVGSGAPPGNTNALKTGRYSPRFVRAACVISLAPSLHEVLHALRRNHRALGGDPSARRRDHDALMAGVRDLAYELTCRDLVLLQALQHVVDGLAPGRRISSRAPTPTRPERDPVTAALLLAYDFARTMPPLAESLDLLVVERLDILARAPAPARA